MSASQIHASNIVKWMISDAMAYVLPKDGDMTHVVEVLRRIAPLIEQFAERGDYSDEAIEQFAAVFDVLVKVKS